MSRCIFMCTPSWRGTMAVYRFLALPPKKCPTSGERLFNLLYTKFDFTVDEGKEWLNPSREKNEGTHRRRKVDE